MKRTNLICVFIVTLLVSFTKGAPAIKPSFGKFIVFGDSISDVKNYYKASNGLFPSNGYYDGRFSDGLLWCDWLSKFLNTTMKNYAFGGAGVDSDLIAPSQMISLNFTFIIPGIKQQVESFLVNTKINDDYTNTLFSLWSAGNDYLSLNFKLNPEIIVNSLSSSIQRLITTVGASYFLIMNMSDVRKSPRFNSKSDETKELIHSTIIRHNELLSSMVTNLSKDYNIQIYFINTYEIFDRAMTKKGQGLLGITNIVDACQPVPVISLPICDKYFWFENIHPTRVVHKAFADEIVNQNFT
ncbi:9186_t:CDS:2 [Funneliformis geosporum]|uniref:19093_t:CDS:1 n=1 Tax=Funneliformis geosporum TaxID=1117311 RepID=A0A9W4SWW8_9GLOM|nr:19093_t:CDS:2 [Funneliformis geosporum]CAI2187000.1 9186_t:CDS:2 [Funneliformis geosporum]